MHIKVETLVSLHAEARDAELTIDPETNAIRVVLGGMTIFMDKNDASTLAQKLSAAANMASHRKDLVWQ